MLDDFIYNNYRDNVGSKNIHRRCFEIVKGIDQSKDLSILDIGCANGAFIEMLSTHYHNISGIDLNQKLISIATIRNPTANLRVGDFQSIKYDSVFDIITAIGLVEMVPSLSLFMQSMHNAVSDNGHIVIQVLINCAGYTLFPTIIPDIGEPFHAWNIYSHEYINKCASGLFRLVKSEIFVPPKRTRPNNPLNSWTELLSDGQIVSINGLNLWYDIFFYTFQKI